MRRRYHCNSVEHIAVNCPGKKTVVGSAAVEVSKRAKKTKSGEVTFEERNGVLVRLFKPLSGGKLVKQIMVPEEQRKKVLSMAHDVLMSGHRGIKKTLERVLSNFYWPGVAGDVRRYCRSCDVCQKTIPKGDK